MKRLLIALLAIGLLGASPQSAEASQASVFRAKVKKTCGDGARWYCHMDIHVYCRPDGGCTGDYTEGHILAGSRTCFAGGIVYRGSTFVSSYEDSCHRKAR